MALKLSSRKIAAKANRRYRHRLQSSNPIETPQCIRSSVSIVHHTMIPPPRKRIASRKVRENGDVGDNDNESSRPETPTTSHSTEDGSNSDTDNEPAVRIIQRSAEPRIRIDYTPAIRLESVDREYAVFALRAVFQNMDIPASEQQQGDNTEGATVPAQFDPQTATVQPAPLEQTPPHQPNNPKQPEPLIIIPGPRPQVNHILPGIKLKTVTKRIANLCVKAAPKPTRPIKPQLIYAGCSWEEDDVPVVVKLGNNQVKVKDTIVNVDCVHFLTEGDVPLDFDRDCGYDKVERRVWKRVFQTCTLSCRLGCICESIRISRRRRDHCGRPECFFESCCCPILNRPVLLEQRLRSRLEGGAAGVRQRSGASGGRVLKALVNPSNKRKRRVWKENDENYVNKTEGREEIVKQVKRNGGGARSPVR